MNSLKTTLGPLELDYPVLAASGTFGFGEEYSSLLELKELGGIVVKGLTLHPRSGNRPPRVTETPAGMLNAIGLQNPGLEYFLEVEMPRLQQSGTAVIVNINGEKAEEFVTLARELSSVEGIAALELNVSCPNVKRGGIAFGTSPAILRELLQKVRPACKLPFIVKLSPNVTDIVELARVCREEGADILSLINTLKGMVIDTSAKKPFLGNITGGLSGPAVRPVAVRMVYEVFQELDIPIIGMGGIMNTEDALQFMMAGAQAVAVGTANFVEPRVIPQIISGLGAYLEQEGLNSLAPLIGAAHSQA